MHDQSDIQLLRDYAQSRSEAAFRELVTRHTDFVFSAALRQVESPDLAADLAQSVFTDLARKARPVAEKMPAHSSLAGWLHRSTRYAALNHLRDTRRRQANERQAMEQLLTNAGSAPDWEHIKPVLDEALDSLGDEDREALLLRYFKNQDFRAIGLALGTSDDTAQKRVSRAVDRLRDFFSQRNITIGASGLVVLISANAVQAAPVGLAAAIATATLTGSAVSTATLAATTKTIAMTTLQKALVTATVAVLAGAGIYEAREASRLREQNQALQQQQASDAEHNRQLQRERDEATNRLAALLAEKSRGISNPDQAELLKLRGEVAVLQNQANDPSDQPIKKVVAKVQLLKQLLAQRPDKQIPELQFLTDKVWADVAWNADLDTEDGIRVAFSNLRGEAENVFLNEMVFTAIKKYLSANNETLPASLLDLKSYFDVPVTDAMLGRYELMQTGKPDPTSTLVKLSTYADPEYDSNHEITLHGASGGGFNRNQDAINDAAREFARGNNFQAPTDPSQIAPLLHKQIDDVTIRKYLGQFVVDPPSPEEQVMAPVLSAYYKQYHTAFPGNISDLQIYVTTPEQQAVLDKWSKKSR